MLAFQRHTNRRSASGAAARRGMSLLDVSMAVLVSGILVAVATPKFFGSLESQRSLAAARRMAADIRYARQRAIAGSTTQVVRFSSQNLYSYRLDNVPDPANPELTWTVDLTESPWKSTVSSVNAGVNYVLSFDLNGTPNSAGTITIASGSRQRTVTIASTGKVTAP
jgi:Tfp pilus assembly protein FimT